METSGLVGANHISLPKNLPAHHSHFAFTLNGLTYTYGWCESGDYGGPGCYSGDNSLRKVQSGLSRELLYSLSQAADSYFNNYLPDAVKIFSHE
jgi:hypothetical protein